MNSNNYIVVFKVYFKRRTKNKIDASQKRDTSLSNGGKSSISLITVLRCFILDSKIQKKST
jgi:hypothetical protein